MGFLCRDYRNSMILVYFQREKENFLKLSTAWTIIFEDFGGELKDA
jgi:hypothetical protein